MSEPARRRQPDGHVRERNPRGQGQRLHEQLVEAATNLLAALGSADSLTLRAVAREVGVTPASIYSHFADLDALVKHVLEERYADLTRETDQAVARAVSPAERLVARCWVYVHWGLAHPGHYRVVFEGRVTGRHTPPVGGAGGLHLLQGLATALSDVTAAHPARQALNDPGDAWRDALLLWTALHGIISLRIDRPDISWPPVDGLTAEVLALHTGLSRSAVLSQAATMQLTRPVQCRV